LILISIARGHNFYVQRRDYSRNQVLVCGFSKVDGQNIVQHLLQSLDAFGNFPLMNILMNNFIFSPLPWKHSQDN